MQPPDSPHRALLLACCASRGNGDGPNQLSASQEKSRDLQGHAHQLRGLRRAGRQSVRGVGLTAGAQGNQPPALDSFRASDAICGRLHRPRLIRRCQAEGDDDEAMTFSPRCKNLLLARIAALAITRPNLQQRTRRRLPRRNRRESQRGVAKTSSGDRHRPASKADRGTSGP